MRYLVAFLAISLAISLGSAGMVYGEFGDAPELMLLGLVLVVGAVAFGVRSVRRGCGS
jgi:hypothetical protein